MTEKVSTVYESVAEFLTLKGFDLVGALLILGAGLLISRWVATLLRRWLSTREIEPPIRALLVKALSITLFAITALIALQTIGVQIMPLIAGAGIAGVGLGLAMQGVLSNIVAGFVIIFTKPYRVGEYIELLGVEGQVEEIELSTTVLLHPDRSRVVIPNRKVVGEILHNFGTIRQLNLTVGVAYRSDLNRTLEAVREVLRNNERVLKEPAPVIGITTLGDSSVNVSARPWVAIKDFGAARAEIYQGLLEKFRAENIEIPFPQREVRMLET